jgi:dienelactone hydrolase
MATLGRGAVRSLLGLDEYVDAPVPLELEDEQVGRDGVVRRRGSLRARDGDLVPVWLMLPEMGVRGAPGVLFHHQHASQWHLGKSEVAGLAGDPVQAFGPSLARRGVVVLAVDSVGFEDRRARTVGTQPDGDDGDQWGRQLTSRLVVGDTLARKVLTDAEDALRALKGLREIDADRVGVAGHSYGGTVTTFQAAVDQKIAFACVSGAAGTYRQKIARDIGIDLVKVVPGIVQQLDMDDLLASIAPRPLLIAAGETDRYAADAQEIIDSVAAAYEELGAGDALRGAIYPGGHALTQQRHDDIVDWIVATA